MPGRPLRRAAAALLAGALAAPAPACAALWREDFRGGTLDASRWLTTGAGDARERAVGVVPASDGAGFELRLAVDTRGTRDDTVKHVGVVSRCALALGDDALIGAVVDWGPPANASYLAAALILSPHLTRGDPRVTGDWLSVGYVGVPPGGNARLLVRSATHGVVRTLFDEGWPRDHREGRPVLQARLTLRLHGDAVEIGEDARRITLPGPRPAGFERVHLYLQLSSHSNYPPRAVGFGALEVRTGDPDVAPVGLPVAPECAGGD